MKILVFAHRFDVGGSQVNVVDLTAALRDRYGHDVAIFATPGAMVEIAKKRGLRFIPAPDVNTYPSLIMMKALRAVVRREKPDLIHAWDWWQCLDAHDGVYLTQRIPLMLSDMVSDGILIGSYRRRCLLRSVPRNLWTRQGRRGDGQSSCFCPRSIFTSMRRVSSIYVDSAIAWIFAMMS